MLPNSVVAISIHDIPTSSFASRIALRTLPDRAPSTDCSLIHLKSAFVFVFHYPKYEQNTVTSPTPLPNPPTLFCSCYRCFWHWVADEATCERSGQHLLLPGQVPAPGEFPLPGIISPDISPSQFASMPAACSTLFSAVVSYCYSLCLTTLYIRIIRAQARITNDKYSK